MTSKFNLPRLEPEHHRWTLSPTCNHSVQRIAIGTEQWVGIKHENAKGQYDNYLSTTLSLKSAGLSLEDLHRYVVSALIHIRFRHPEVAATALWEANKSTPPTIRYSPPVSISAVQEWAVKTVSIRTGNLNGHDLRTEQEESRRGAGPQHAESVTVLLCAEVATEQSLLPKDIRITMMCQFNHIFWDAMSSRQFVGDLLRQTGFSWDGRDDPTAASSMHSWGEEIKNLAEPVLDALKVNVKNLGQDYDAATDEFIASLLKTESSWGLAVNNTVGVPRTEFFTFTNAQSIAMIKGVKSRVGHQYTISHLGHTAMVLALLKIQPLPTDVANDVHLVSPLPVNGRRFLKDLATDRYGSCQAGAVVQFPALKSWVVDENDADTVKVVLERGCRHIKAGYDYWLNKDFQVAVNVSKDNFLAAYLSSATPVPKKTNIPVFVSDGEIDRYVPASVSTRDNKELFSVDSCDFLLDTYQSDIFIRMDSFKGVTALSITYNDGFLSRETARSLLVHMSGFMLAISDIDTSSAFCD